MPRWHSSLDDKWLNKEFGCLLLQLRQTAGLSQEELARRSALSRTSIVNVEKGRQGVSLDTLFRLSKALGVTPAELLPNAPSENGPRIAIGPDSSSTRSEINSVLRSINRKEGHR